MVAIQTQRNGPLLLSFLMLGLMLLALLLTHFNLQGLELRCGEPAAGFADATLHYPLLLQSHIPRQAIRLRFSGTAAPTGAGAGATAGATLDQLVPGQTRLAPAWRCPQRGRQLPGTLVIESTAPLGLFLCWSRWRPAAPQTVYPARISGPVGHGGAAAARATPTPQPATRREGQEEWPICGPTGRRTAPADWPGRCWPAAAAT